MIDLLSNYGLFFVKLVTLVVAIFVLFGGVLVIIGRNKVKVRERIEITKINKKYEEIREILCEEIYSKKELRELKKQEKQKEKVAEQECKKSAKAKAKCTRTEPEKKRIFVLDFYGDIRATEVDNLRQEVTAILTVATPKDEVLVKIESSGGLIHTYGLAASQLKRIRDRHIPLVVAVDAVAASGGYMMACVADRILAAPFAVVGSIGVITQLPNFNRFLKKHDIDFEQISAGEYKRTLTLFGENTSKGRQKMQEEIEKAHELFKEFVAIHRPVVNIKTIATGEHWFGQQAKDLRLIDEITTSDDYLLQASAKADLYEITYIIKKKLFERLPMVMGKAFRGERIFGVKEKTF